MKKNVETDYDFDFSALKIGESQIDHEHQLLFSSLQGLIKTSHSQETADRFHDILSDLGTEIIRHFEHEEAIFKSLGMAEDEVIRHQQAHLEIIKQYTDLNLALMHDKAIRREDVLPMVMEWVLSHVIHYDMKMRPFFIRRGKTSREPN